MNDFYEYSKELGKFGCLRRGGIGIVVVAEA